MEEKEPSERSQGECVVLYVEDDDATAYLFQQALKETGAHLHLFRVSDGEKALAFLSRSGIYRDAPQADLVILDVNLPRVNGFEVLTVIRQTHALKSIPVVVFTSSTQVADEKRALALGASKFFTKSNDWDSFLQTTRSICDLAIRRSTHRVADQAKTHIDYCLNILGIRVQGTTCQLIAKVDNEWSSLGPKRELPLEFPHDEPSLKRASNDTLLITAWQYEREHPGTDIREVLSTRIDFAAALLRHD